MLPYKQSKKYASKKAPGKKATSKKSTRKSAKLRSPTPIRPTRSPRPKSNLIHPCEEARRARKSTRFFEKLFAANEPSEDFMASCARQLATVYDSGLIVSFNPRTVQWEEVNRPFILRDDGTMTSLHGFQFGSALPTLICPHSLNPYRCLEECTMSLFRTPDGIDYFEARNGLHKCSLRVLVPTMNDPLSDEFAWEHSHYPHTPEAQAPLPPFHVYFNREKANSRALYDTEFCSRMESSYCKGDFSSGVVVHPTHTIPTAEVLRPWDLSLDQTAHRNANHFTQFIGTDIGHAIRELHSTCGIPSETWHTIRDDCVVCSICSCAFSNAGYFDHIVPGGYCHNWYQRRKVIPDINQRRTTLQRTPTVPEGAPDWADVFAPSRAALIEWNSRIGVPRDVWAVISTMEINCDGCGRCRSYAAHKAHLQDGLCSF